MKRIISAFVVLALLVDLALPGTGQVALAEEVPTLGEGMVLGEEALADEGAADGAEDVADGTAEDVAEESVTMQGFGAEGEAGEEFALSEDVPVEPDTVLISVPEGMSAGEVLAALDEAGVEDVSSAASVVDGVVEVTLASGTTVEDGVNELATLDFVQGAQPDYVYFEEDGGDEPGADLEGDAAVEVEEEPASQDSASEEEPATDPAADSVEVVAAEESNEDEIVVEAEGESPESAKPEADAESVGLQTQAVDSRFNDTYYKYQWDLACANVLGAWNQEYTGSGIGVAVIDSGFDVSYADMNGQYKGSYNVKTGNSNVFSSPADHGSLVSSVVAAKADNSYGIAGVAYNAHVVPVKCDKYTSSSLLKAYEYILNHRSQYNIRVICTSFGSDWSNPNDADLLVAQKIEEAYAVGIVSAGSAGNNGTVMNHCPCDCGVVVGVMGLENGAYTESNYQSYNTYNASTVYRCGSSNYNGVGEVSKNISAPGFRVPIYEGHQFGWGTSYAAPHVAGTLALMFQANPNLTSTQAVSALYSTATDMGDAGWDRYYGHGAIDAGAAVSAVKAGNWVQGPAFIAVGSSATYSGGAGGRKVGLRGNNGSVASVSTTSTGATVTGRAAGVVRLTGNHTSGKTMSAEVNVVGPIQGAGSLSVGQSATYTMAQPYHFLWRWSINGGKVQTTSNAVTITANSAGTTTITAQLVADPSVSISKTISITGGSSSGSGSATSVVTSGVTYRTHVQKKGWRKWSSDGKLNGTTGKSLRLEAIQIKLVNKPFSGSIAYRTHVQKNGWEKSWRKDGKKSGTSGKALRLEAIQIKLTGQMAQHYDVYYRVHAQKFGWMGWAKNGAKAGTAGYGRRLEAIQVILVPKGQSKPAKNYAGIKQKTSAAFKQKK